MSTSLGMNTSAGMNTSRVRSVTVLGSTGSVGTQTIELLASDPDRFRVRALVAGRNAALLAEQAIALCARSSPWSPIPRAIRTLREALAGTGIDGRGRRRGGGRGRVAAGGLDHGGDHRRGRPGADAGRHPPRRVYRRWPTRRRWSAPAT